MKKFIGFLLLFIVISVTILFFARDILLKAYLERKMSQANNAEVTIGSLDLDYFERYITLKDVKIMSNLNEEEVFISIDKLKSYYNINFSKKIITFDDAEVEGISFFKDAKYEYNPEEDMVVFENKVTEAEEKAKREKVLAELKNLYLNKIEENHLNLNEVFSRNLSNRTDLSELEKIKQSIKNIKESTEKNLNISEVVGEISNIGKSTKKLGQDLDIKDLSKTEDELKDGMTLEESLDRVVRNFLNRNKLVLFDLDGYINMYLNLVYEQKIYNLSLKYRNILDEIRVRKEKDSKLDDEDVWELFFNSISITSNVYGISFNGEVKNFSTRLSKDTDNTEFKLFGEKGNTIGEFKGFINFDTELTDSQLESTKNHFHAENIQVHGKVELTSKDHLSITLTQKESQRINWDISSNYGSIFQFTREEPKSRGTELSNPYKTEKTEAKDQLIARADNDIELISIPNRR